MHVCVSLYILSSKENKQDGGEWYDIGYDADTIIIASQIISQLISL